MVSLLALSRCRRDRDGARAAWPSRMGNSVQVDPFRRAPHTEPFTPGPSHWIEAGVEFRVVAALLGHALRHHTLHEDFAA